MNIINEAKSRVKTKYSQLTALLNGNTKRSQKYLKSIKNTYPGERCFILGNGPSLNAKDLEMLKDEVTFASNRIFKIFDETDWRPTYYAVFDGEVGASEGVIDGINSFDCKMKFVRREDFRIYKNVKEPFCSVKTFSSEKLLDNPQFADDVTKGLYTIASVTYTMMEIAVYMGFTEIYLLGVDHKYSNTVLKDGTIVKDATVKSYFGTQNNDENNITAALWQSDIAFGYAEEYSKSHNFRVYNATRGGCLEAFERVDLEKVLSDKRIGK